MTVHGTNSADEAMKIERQKKKNTPVQLPPGIPSNALPSEEFTQIMNMVEKGTQPSQVTVPQSTTPQPEPKIEPIVLKYKYEGMDSCGNKVNTLELDADGKHFVTAYCLICQKQVEIREVIDLNPKKEKTKNG